jgi:hypothetical protein
MFDVLPYENLNITAFDLHIFDEQKVGIQIYTKDGSFGENTCGDWTLVTDMEVNGQGMNAVTKVILGNQQTVRLDSHKVQSFYITITNGTGLRYSQGSGTGRLAASNEHLSILEGVGVSSQCNSTFQDRVFNGALHYELGT